MWLTNCVKSETFSTGGTNCWRDWSGTTRRLTKSSETPCESTTRRVVEFFVKSSLPIEKESCGLVAGGKMVVAIGLDESLLTNKKKPKTPWTFLDGWSWWTWSPFICRTRWMRLIRLIQADWNPKRSVWIEAERTELTCHIHCHVDIMFNCSRMINTVNNLLRFFCWADYH